MTGSFQLSLIAVNDLLDGSQLLAIGIFVETAEQRQSMAHGESGGLEVWLRKAPLGRQRRVGLPSLRSLLRSLLRFSHPSHGSVTSAQRRQQPKEPVRLAL